MELRNVKKSSETKYPDKDTLKFHMTFKNKPTFQLEAKEGKYFLDLKGYMCPYPQFLTLQALKKLKDGEILEVITDNPASCENVPAAVKRAGHEVLSVEKIGLGVWKIVVIKRGSK
jgi:tRNA 2-thiouridine synthesizing protein A